jgi:hypothetical protein
MIRFIGAPQSVGIELFAGNISTRRASPPLAIARDSGSGTTSGRPLIRAGPLFAATVCGPGQHHIRFGNGLIRRQALALCPGRGERRLTQQLARPR